MQHIDKAIYAQEGVAKHLQPLNKWYYIFSVLGIVCTILYLLIPNLSGFLSALLLMGLSLGDFCLVVTLCYYLFGDCRKPYDKSSGTFWDRTFDYYPSSSQAQLTDALAEGSRENFDKIKRCPTSDLMAVRYDNAQTGAAFCQLLKQRESSEEPLTEIFKLK